MTRLAVAVPVGVFIFVLQRFLLFFPVTAVASVLAAGPPGGGVPLPHEPRERSLRSLLQIPTMAMNVATHVSLLLVVGLMVAPYQSGMLALRSHLSWRAVARAGVASFVVPVPRIQRFPFAFEFALTAARLFVAVMVLRLF